MFTSLVHGLTLAVRTLARRPGWTAHATLSLALGIGATTAVYTVARAVLFVPLPLADPGRALALLQDNPARDRTGALHTPGRYLDLHERLRTVEQVGALWLLDANLQAGGTAERAHVGMATASWLPALGGRIVAGRTFAPSDEQPGAPPVALISRSLWRRRFAGTPDLADRRIVLDGSPYTVVGVVADDLAWPAAVDAWTPVALTIWNRASRTFHVVARLAPGRSSDELRRELERLDGELGREYPGTDGGWRTVAVPLQRHVSGRAGQPLLLLLGAGAALLLVAGLNVANLLLALGVESERELAIRAALGARAHHLAGLLVARSLVVAVAGGAAGALVAWMLTRGVVPLAAGFLPRASEVGFDARSVAFAAALAVLSALAAGLASAVAPIRAARAGRLQGLRTSAGTGRRRLRDLLVAAEIALTFALTVSAALMLTTLARLSQVETGFRTDSLLTARVSLPMRVEQYRGDAMRARFWDALLQKIQVAPGIDSAALVSSLPVGGARIPFKFFTDDQAETEPREAEYRAVSAGYFTVAGIRVLAGRAFADADGREGRHVAIVNEALARRTWPEGGRELWRRTALSRSLSLSGPGGPFLPIVGVVADVRQLGVDQPPAPEIYVPYPQEGWPQMTVVVKGSGSMRSVGSSIRTALRELDSALGLYEVRPFADVLGEAFGFRRVVTAVLVAFALVALLLASVGVSGLLAYRVAVRHREIGIRVALGASRTGIVRMVAGHGVRLAFAGTIAGAVVAAAAARWLRGLLFGVGPLDPATFGLVSAVLLSAALLASAAPALRAASVDPVAALRSE